MPTVLGCDPVTRMTRSADPANATGSDDESSGRSQKDDAVRPIRVALCFPDGAECGDKSSDVVWCECMLIHEDDTAVVDTLLSPEPQQWRNGPQVKRHQR